MAVVSIALRRLALGILLVGATAAHATANRLADIRGRGVLTCGVWPQVPGFAIERDGRFSGFDIDICRAVAATILGDAAKVRFVSVANVQQFLERADVDLAVRRLTWTLSRETATGTAFGPVTFYDGQGFLVPKGQPAASPICVLNEEHYLQSLNNHFKARMKVVPVANDEQAQMALLQHRCRTYSADISWLAAARSKFRDGVARYDILPELISREPLAPLVRAADAGLLQSVRWTVFAMIDAEERGLNSHNIASTEPAHNIIAGVGNYGEVFERNLGAASAIKLDRGLNRLWRDGGLLYAPPLDR